MCFFKLLQEIKKTMSRSSSFWIMHYLGGLQFYQQRLLAMCLVEASPIFSARNPISSIRPVTFITRFYITRDSDYRIITGLPVLLVLYGSENKQRLFPYTTLTDWFV